MSSTPNSAPLADDEPLIRVQASLTPLRMLKLFSTGLSRYPSLESKATARPFPVYVVRRAICRASSPWPGPDLIRYSFRSAWRFLLDYIICLGVI